MMLDQLLLVLVTALLTALLTLLASFYFTGRTSSSTREPRLASNPFPNTSLTTYRVQGIPSTCNEVSTQELLQSILIKDDYSLIIIRSLAYDPMNRKVKVATFIIRGNSTQLSDTGRQWDFVIPKGKYNSDDVYSRDLSLLIDTHFEGFTPLNSFENSEEHRVDCIAISGLGGNAFSSFKEKGGEHMWLRDSLPRDIPGLRVLIYGYSSELSGSTSFQDLEAISTGFRTLLGAVRRQVNAETLPKPLVFVAHSLGGLVLKKALVHMKGSTNNVDKANFQSTYAALFFGVPNQGMNIASLIPMVEGGQNLPFLMSLGKDSELLRNLSREFKSAFNFKDSIVMSYYETRTSPTAKEISKGVWKRIGEPAILVEMSSATHGRSWEDNPHNIQAINRDHSALVKFLNHDEVYYGVRDLLKEFSKDSVNVIHSRFINQSGLSREQIKCLTDLNRPPFSDIRDRIIHDPEEGTLQWFFTSEFFRSWRDEESSSNLWIRGSPGQGKSVLAKAVLNHFDRTAEPESQERPKVIYYFCYKQEKDSRTLSSIIRALIVQLLTSSHTSMFEHLPQTYMTKPNDFVKESSPATLWGIFCKLLCDPYYKKIYCVIDALDECECYSTELLPKILKLASMPTAANLKLFVTSRPLEDITHRLEKFPHKDLKAITEDLKIFVKSKVSTLPRCFDSKLREKAAVLLLERVERTFLWVSIVVKKLDRLSLPTVADLEATIKQSPTDLVALYSSIIEQVKEGPPKGQKLVAWVVYGRRPLTMKELEAALATQTDSKDKESTEDYRPNLTAEALASTAGIILEITNDTVHLIHQSAKDFIVQEEQLAEFGCFEGLVPNVYLAKICMTYLNFEDFEIGPCNSKELLERKTEYPLLDYAARKWHSHIQSLDDIKENLEVLNQLIKPQSPKLLCWGEASDIENLDAAKDVLDIATAAGISWLADYRVDYDTITKEKVVNAAKNFGKGYEIIERRLLQPNVRIDEEAILELVRTGNERIVNLLLNNHGDKITAESISLAAVANLGNGPDVMRLLLEAGYAISITSDLVKVALENKISGDHIIGLLLSKDNIEITEAASALIVKEFDVGIVKSLIYDRNDFKITAAVISGTFGDPPHLRKLELLLKRRPIQITEAIVISIVKNLGVKGTMLLLENTKSNHIVETAMMAAQDANDSRTVLELIRIKADTNVTKEMVELAASNEFCDESIMNMLLSKNDVHVTQGAIQAAAGNRNGDHNMLKVLLERSDFHVADSVLETAAGNRHGEQILRMLLNEPDVLATDAMLKALISVPWGIEMIDWLLCKSRIKITETFVIETAQDEYNGAVILELLLQRCDTQITDLVIKVAFMEDQFSKLLPLAISKEHEAAMELLLESGADITAVNETKETALHVAARNGYTAVARSMLEKGADVNSAAYRGRKALGAAAESGHLEIVNMLLNSGADANAAAGDYGQTALQAAAGAGNIEIVNTLLNSGADVNAIIHKNYGRTALQAAVEAGNIEIVNTLLNSGADVNASASFFGRTALQAAAQIGPIEIVNTLLNSGADINARSNHETALGYAVLNKHVKIRNKLLSAGADYGYIFSSEKALWRALSHSEKKELLFSEDESRIDGIWRNYRGGY